MANRAGIDADAARPCPSFENPCVMVKQNVFHHIIDSNYIED